MRTAARSILRSLRRDSRAAAWAASPLDQDLYGIADPGDSRRYSGAERLRRRIDRGGSAVCGLCDGAFPAELVDVDHRTPLSLGGEDTDDNVWPLCRTCHRGKTAGDFGAFAVGP
ncbi:HNH endonuclease signature motif containing protein [Kitasatospora sp. NPDC094016]|uniref:HNH endonuclease n=1 Tax=Kitasatospora sp. NPDC094016 TaxID=3154986 RepID=UPI003320643A